jgi:hypothetical protein
MFRVRLPLVQKGAIATIFYSLMIFHGTPGCFLCALPVRCSLFISSLRPWSALSIPRPFVYSVLILLVSISLSTYVVFLLSTPPSVPIVHPPGPCSDVPSSTPAPSSTPSSSPSSPRSPVSESSSAIPSSSSFDESSSSDELPSPLPVTRLRRAPDRYSPSQYGLSVASEPISYQDAERHPEW